jgi:hypothetical protein
MTDPNNSSSSKPQLWKRRSSGVSSNSSSSSSQRERERNWPRRTYVHHYHDHSTDPTYHPAGNRHRHKGAAPSSISLDVAAAGRQFQFPEILYKMLHDCTASSSKDGSTGGDFADIVSWQPHGRSFLVHQPKVFVAQVLPRYFRQSKLSSFQRQLSMYQFSRITQGEDKGAYYHEYFLRGRPDLLSHMVRITIKGTGCKLPSSPETEPNFYTMPFCYDDHTQNEKKHHKQQQSQHIPARHALASQAAATAKGSQQIIHSRTTSTPLVGSFSPKMVPIATSKPTQEQILASTNSNLLRPLQAPRRLPNVLNHDKVSPRIRPLSFSLLDAARPTVWAAASRMEDANGAASSSPAASTCSPHPLSSSNDDFEDSEYYRNMLLLEEEEDDDDDDDEQEDDHMTNLADIFNSFLTDRDFASNNSSGGQQQQQQQWQLMGLDSSGRNNDTSAAAAANNSNSNEAMGVMDPIFWL